MGIQHLFSQFRSRHCNGDLKTIGKTLGIDAIVTWCYFEAHEGKNISDTVGSIVKMAFDANPKTNKKDFIGKSHSFGGDQPDAFDIFY